jgi:hypothetical protein
MTISATASITAAPPISFFIRSIAGKTLRQRLTGDDFGAPAMAPGKPGSGFCQLLRPQFTCGRIDQISRRTNGFGHHHRIFGASGQH